MTDSEERWARRQKEWEESCENVRLAAQEGRAASECGHKEDDYCNCNCHDKTSKSVTRHIVPCCYTCPVCGQRLVY